MALGDNDLASGVFFADFGQPVVFNGVTAFGNFDAPAKDATFGKVDVADTEYCLVMALGAFAPMPKVASRLTVAGVPYQVRSVLPVDDGMLLEYKLRAL